MTVLNESVGRGQQVSINLTSSSLSMAAVVQQLTDAADEDGGGLRQCVGHWRPGHQALYHVAHALLLVAFLIPSCIRRAASVVFMHLTLVAGTLQYLGAAAFRS